MRNFILGIIITSLFSFLAHLYFKNESLSAQIITLKSNITSSDGNVQKFKESYFIEQQNRDTTLILFTVTALFGLFSFFTFASVKRMFDTNISEMNNKFNNQVEKSKKVIIHIKNLEGDLSFEVAKNIVSDLKKMRNNEDEESRDYVEIIALSLTACDYYSKSLYLKSDINEKFKAAVESLLSEELNYTSELLSSQSSFQLEYMDYERFLRIKYNIEKVGSKVDLKNLASIFSKLSFPDLN